jgi:hypothetical protein
MTALQQMTLLAESLVRVIEANQRGENLLSEDPETAEEFLATWHSAVATVGSEVHNYFLETARQTEEVHV